MTKKTVELETPYTAEGRLTPTGFQLRSIRIQGVRRLDAFNCYWPPLWLDRYLRRLRRWLRRVWRWLAGR